MDVDALNINAQLAVEEDIKTEIKTINTEREAVVHKLKEALKFLENVNVQNEESLQLANLHAPLDDLLSNLKYCPVEDGRCFNDLPTELKANILSESYLCDSCAYVAASVCHEWKVIIEKRVKLIYQTLLYDLTRDSIYTCSSSNPSSSYMLQLQPLLMERDSIYIGDDEEEEDEEEEDFHCFMPSAEEMLKAAIIHKMTIKLVISRPVTNVDPKLLAEGLTTISDFQINDNMCFGCNGYAIPVELTESQLEHLFNAMEEKTEINRVCLCGLSTAHLDQEKVIDCLFKVKELTLADGTNCDDRCCYELRGGELCEPGGPVVDMKQFVGKLLQASSGMKLLDLHLGYFVNIPRNLSVNLANALCKVKSVRLRKDFPLEDATREQLIRNIRGGDIVMNSLSIMKEIRWNSVITLEDLEMVMRNLKRLKLMGNFTAEQLKMARSLSGVQVIEEINDRGLKMSAILKVAV